MELLLSPPPPLPPWLFVCGSRMRTFQLASSSLQQQQKLTVLAVGNLTCCGSYVKNNIVLGNEQQ
jgi:hypothetical protein